MKKVILTGSTGMVGSLILAQCLESEQVDEVIHFVRKPFGDVHEKLTTIILKDFEDYSGHLDVFKDVDVAFFCLGAYTGQVSDDLFKKITFDFAQAFGVALYKGSPTARLCLLSGSGADRSQKSAIAFAKYKGMAEQFLSDLGLGSFYAFRPGYIYPVTPRAEPNFMYRLSRVLYPVIRLLGPKYSIKSTELASAMFQVGMNGADREVLENVDILRYSV